MAERMVQLQLQEQAVVVGCRLWHKEFNETKVSN